MSIIEAITELIGTPPPGYDIVVWIVASMILIYLLSCAFSIIGSIINWIGGK